MAHSNDDDDNDVDLVNTNSNSKKVCRDLSKEFEAIHNDNNNTKTMRGNINNNNNITTMRGNRSNSGSNTRGGHSNSPNGIQNIYKYLLHFLLCSFRIIKHIEINQNEMKLIEIKQS